MWHGTKSTSVLKTQNGSKLYVIYDVYIVYTTFLDPKCWIKIKVVVNKSGCKTLYILPFIYILTIQLGWNNLKCLLKLYVTKKTINIVIIFDITTIFA
jgi:hypothetical protein